MNSPSERRRFQRSDFHAPAHVTVQGGDRVTRLLDISLKGALVEHDGSWAAVKGQKCHFRLELGAGAVITMETTVAHVEGRHIGLHCDHIDIDSVTHLRQLVEHNAQDPASLDRDLAMLVAQR